MEEILEAFAALAVAHPRVAGVLLAMGAVLSLIGAVCAQIDADALERDGYPRAARAVRIGAEIGAFALRLRARKEAEK